MNYTFPKNAAIVVIMLLSLSFQSAYSQSKKPSQDVTTTMARKIRYYCQYNEMALSLFAVANAEQVQNNNARADRLLWELDKHLDCAENFIITLYYNYGVTDSYFALKDAGFTIMETDMAESIWKKETEKQKVIEEKKRKEKEQALLQRIEKNDVFTKDDLSVQPDIEIDISNMATYTVFNDKNEYLSYEYKCIISKEGKLLLKNPSDTLNYSATQKFIYQYISDENMGAGIYKAGCIDIEGKNIPVNSYFNIKFSEHRLQHDGYLFLTIKKNKKTGQWEILPYNSTDLMHWTCDEPERLKLDLEYAIYNCPQLQKRKGKVQLKIDVYKRSLSSNISDKIEISHYFAMDDGNCSYDRRSGKYIPLEYKISF